MRKLILEGKKYNRLTIIEKAGRYKGDGTFLYKCKCDCGNEKILQGYRVKNGTIKSCGCWLKDNPTRLVHGMTGTRFFNIWGLMLNRCKNKKTPDYKNYGGREIKVCKRWHKFMNFKNDMYESYIEHVKKFGEKKTSIDRIDNNGNYCKKNCKWATPKIQCKNRRNNIVVEFNGEKKILMDWAKSRNVSFKCLRGRLDRGWTIKETLTLPWGYKLKSKK